MGYFGIEFPAICNRREVMAAWSRKAFQILKKFFSFFGKRPLTVKFSKFCSESFYRDTDRRVVFKFLEICPTGNRWNRALLTRQKHNFAWLSSCRYCADRAQNLPGPAPDNALRVLQISFQSVHFRWSYSRTREHRQNRAIKWIQYSTMFEPNNAKTSTSMSVLLIVRPKCTLAASHAAPWCVTLNFLRYRWCVSVCLCVCLTVCRSQIVAYNK